MANGTAPIAASSGRVVRHRLNRGGNRQLNRALHLAALAQIRSPDTEDDAYYQRCLQRGKTKREATRAPKTAHLRPHLDAPPTHKPDLSLDIEAHAPAM